MSSTTMLWWTHLRRGTSPNLTCGVLAAMSAVSRIISNFATSEGNRHRHSHSGLSSFLLMSVCPANNYTACPLAGMLSFAYFFFVNICDFSVLRTPEIATGIRIPDFRPSCSCLFARQIITQLRLLAGMLCNCLPGLFTHYITCFSTLYTGQTASVARFFIIFNSF